MTRFIWNAQQPGNIGLSMWWVGVGRECGGAGQPRRNREVGTGLSRGNAAPAARSSVCSTGMWVLQCSLERGTVVHWHYSDLQVVRLRCQGGG